jgi:hypothetical protein
MKEITMPNDNQPDALRPAFAPDIRPRIKTSPPLPEPPVLSMKIDELPSMPSNNPP